jgi:hypothetical protein
MAVIAVIVLTVIAISFTPAAVAQNMTDGNMTGQISGIDEDRQREKEINDELCSRGAPGCDPPFTRDNTSGESGIIECWGDPCGSCNPGAPGCFP